MPTEHFDNHDPESGHTGVVSTAPAIWTPSNIPYSSRVDYKSSGGREREALYNIAPYYEGIVLSEVFSTLILCLPLSQIFITNYTHGYVS